MYNISGENFDSDLVKFFCWRGGRTYNKSLAICFVYTRKDKRLCLTGNVYTMNYEDFVFNMVRLCINSVSF